MRWVALLVLAGCSFAFGRGASKPDVHGDRMCARPAVTATVDLLVAGAATAFLVAVAVHQASCSGEACEGSAIELLAIPIGAVGLTSGIYGISQAVHCHRAPPVVIEPLPLGVALVEAVPARDPMATKLTREAHEQATQGHCTGIAALAERVRDVDARYYDRVFVVDGPIASCLRR